MSLSIARKRQLPLSERLSQGIVGKGVGIARANLIKLPRVDQLSNAVLANKCHGPREKSQKAASNERNPRITQLSTKAQNCAFLF